MLFFQIIKQKLKDLLTQENFRKVHIDGISTYQWLLLFEHFNEPSTNLFKGKQNVIVCQDQEEAEKIYDALKTKHSTLLFLGHEYGPYSSIISSEQNLMSQFKTLSDLVFKKDKFKIIITTLDALFLKIPPRSFFEQYNFKLEISDVISPYELAKKLVSIGYKNAPIADKPGLFSQKGEIFDIYPSNSSPIRVHYFDDMIEEIFQIEKETQKTLRNNSYSNLLISASPYILKQEDFVIQLREHIPMPEPRFKNKYFQRKELFSESIKDNDFTDIAHLIPLFFKDTETLSHYLKEDSFFHFFNLANQIENFELFIDSLRSDFIQSQSDVESMNIFPEVSFFYDLNFNLNLEKLKKIIIDDVEIKIDLREEEKIHLKLVDIQTHINTQSLDLKDLNFKERFFKVLAKNSKKEESFFFCYQTEKIKDEIQFLIDNNTELGFLKSKINYIKFPLDKGFYYPLERSWFISQADLFSIKTKKTKKSSFNPDLFAEQMASLKINDFVIHRDHGLGIYKGLESIDVGGRTSDFIVIHYDSEDKVLVPVYKINLIQKQANSDADLKVANLRSQKFNQNKSKIKKSIKKLAFDLLELQAKRKESQGFIFSKPDHDYYEFEHSFPFEETPDQEKAIHDVLEDMQSQTPMDRLICGDVGFGKTEVAMRAAFKAVLDHKQVAVLVPTTVLALQHFESFSKRFKAQAVKVDFISRFKTPSQTKETLDKLKSGEIDIIIGTHKLLAKNIEFNDLGLIVIDEEHRFGVGHKEKLKLLKTNVDCLTMTATPIPRTLQLSFLGIRDLSLIQTPPPRRQSIKTYLIKYDKHTIKDAIEKELKRGGQIFFVHNRVKDIQRIADEIKSLVPHAKISVGHGQMGEKELETKIKEFYAHETDILLSTTIIESGIDIPNANTMIINNADTFGLAQLHQLRGRIGRSDKKAFAYFAIGQNKILSSIAQKRLKALQTFADVGSGFAIASTDLEIRGAGDILGAEQSGHINQVGLELYMEMLNEAISELSGKSFETFNDIEIHTYFDSYIPEDYIQDSGQRLKTYKKLSNSRENEKIDEIESQIEQVYGPIPHNAQNLIFILKIRNTLSKLPLSIIKLSKNKVSLSFNKEKVESNPDLRNRILDFFMSRPKVYKINPNFTIDCSFKEELSKDKFNEFCQLIVSKIS